MKTIYINAGREKVFYSIKELKEDFDFQCQFSNYLFENGIIPSKSIPSSQFDSFVTHERLKEFFNELYSSWKMLTTEKDIIYIRWWEKIITDDLEDFISQLDLDELVHNLVTEKYNSFKVLFKDIKNTNDTFSEFLMHNALKDDSNYKIIDLKKIKEKKEIYIDYKNQEYYTSYEELYKKTKDVLDKSHTQTLWADAYDKDFLSTDSDVVYIDWVCRQVYDNVFKLLVQTRSPITADDMKTFVNTITSSKGDYDELVNLLYDSELVTTVHLNE